MTTTIYTIPGHCTNCDAVKRILDRKGVTYTVIEMTDEMRETFKAEGHQQAPVVEHNGERWAGVRMDKLTTIN